MPNIFLNADCMDPEIGLPSYPDNHFDLAIVDPPYGIGMSGGVRYDRPSRPNSVNLKTKHTRKEWDNIRPCAEYFKQLFRVSANQIIWGGNYFAEYLPPSMGWIYWAKMEDSSDFSDGELAFTSFQRALKRAKVHQFHGTHGGKHRIHPTQKPAILYRWLLENYAQPNDLILDTHVGSASSLIACESMGFNYVGYELDPDYYAAAQNRMSKGIQLQML